MPSGYKVVKEINSKYYSCSLSSVDHPWVVEYAIGTTSIPATGCGPLTLFNKKSQAEDWIIEWVGPNVSVFSAARAHYEILRCEYTESDSNYIFTDAATDMNRHCTTHFSKLPVGTILCDSITPICTVRWS
jgi:hypothetical protein